MTWSDILMLSSLMIACTDIEIMDDILSYKSLG